MLFHKPTHQLNCLKLLFHWRIPKPVTTILHYIISGTWERFQNQGEPNLTRPGKFWTFRVCRSSEMTSSELFFSWLLWVYKWKISSFFQWKISVLGSLHPCIILYFMQHRANRHFSSRNWYSRQIVKVQHWKQSVIISTWWNHILLQKAPARARLVMFEFARFTMNPVYFKL